MGVKRYAVVDGNGNLLIRGAELEIVFAFIRGFVASFYNEQLDVRIVEDPMYNSTPEPEKPIDDSTPIEMTIKEPEETPKKVKPSKKSDAKVEE